MTHKPMSRGKRALPVVALLAVACLLGLALPYSGAKWTVVLHDQGSVQLATGTPPPTPTASATPSPTPSGPNCTYTQGYWKNHPEDWPVDHVTIGGVTYTKAQAIAIFETPPLGDATYCLAHQLIATKLNILNGADPSAVATTVEQADAWLVQHPLGSNPPNPDREVGVTLAEILDGYNNGRIGPGECEGILNYPESDPLCPVCTATPTEPPALTATQALTPEPTATETPIGEPSPEPTLEPTSAATPTLPPTQEPTQEPITTATPTPEPTPSLTSTLPPTQEATQEPITTPTLEPTPTAVP